MAFLQYRFLSQFADENLFDILIARLNELGFEGFWQKENELYAYADENTIEAGFLEEFLKDPVFLTMNVSCLVEAIAEKNWNEEWEKSYNPVIVDEICSIIAPFHESPDVGITLIIEPKMSFGTGHHQTTRLMIRQIHSMDISDLNVLDMGCGTGVLGIYCLAAGAKFVTSIDIDTWACENSRENFNRNGFDDRKFTIIHGDVNMMPGNTFELILANINRNILLADIPVYARHLKISGTLVVSGILESDKNVILEVAERHSLNCTKILTEGKWVSMKFIA